MKSNEQIIDELFTLARDHHETARAKVVAAVAIRGVIVSYGFNQMKSHPFQKKFGKNQFACFLHAETDAIKNSLKVVSATDLKKATLFVCRSKKEAGRDVFGLAKPCRGCQKCANFFGLKEAVYSLDLFGYETMKFES